MTSWIRFSHWDALIISAIACWSFAIFASIIVEVTDGDYDDLWFPLFGMSLAVSFAIGAAIWLKKINWLRAGLLACVLLVGAGLYVFSGEWLTINIGDYALTINVFEEVNSSQSNRSHHLLVALYFAIGGLIGGLMMALIFNLPLKHREKLSRLFKENRAKILIGVAIFLFVMNLLLKILVGAGLSVFGHRLTLAGGVGYFFGAIVPIVLLFFVIFLPVKLALNPKYLRLNFLLATVFLFAGILVTGLLAYFMYHSGDLTYSSDILSPLTVLSTSVMFLFSLLAVGVHGSANDANGNTQAERPAKINRPTVLVLFGAVLYSACVGIALWTYDPGLLLGNLEMTFDDPKGAFENSAEARMVERESSGSVKFLLSREGTAYWVTIRDERDANVLQVIATRTQFTRDFIIENIQPFVKIPSGLTLSGVSLRGGSVSSEQFAELVNSSTWISLVDIHLPAKKDPSCGPIGNLQISSRVGKLTGLGPFLESHIDHAWAQPVFLDVSLTPDNWNSVVRASQFRKFLLQWKHPGKEIYSQKQLALSQSNIHLYNNEIMPEDDPVLLRHLLETGLSYHCRGRIDESPLQWDVAFGLRISPMELVLPDSVGASADAFIASAKKSNWIYAEDAAGLPTKMWMPDTTYISPYIRSLSSLKTLRMDRESVVFESLWNFGNANTDLSELSNIASLERLFLPRFVPYEDMQFLGGLKQLKFLQIQSQDRSPQSGTGFETLVNLEELVMFGSPDSQSIVELSGLKNLTKISIVDDDGVYHDPAEVDTLKKIFPNASIVIVREEDFQPTFSEDWKRHIETIRERLWARVRELEQAKIENDEGE